MLCLLPAILCRSRSRLFSCTVIAWIVLLMNRDDPPSIHEPDSICSGMHTEQTMLHEWCAYYCRFKIFGICRNILTVWLRLLGILYREEADKGDICKLHVTQR